MISFDTNIVFAALETSAPGHKQARTMLVEEARNHRVLLCELVLTEVYCLLRNPAVARHPLSAVDAVEAIEALRRHKAWRIVDYVPEVADAMWKAAATPGFAFRNIYDVRIALTLRHHGVTEFATRNVKDFQIFGFKRVWDPLVSDGRR
ncbi:MAG TPA: type II toxin-antitoxin system VapC family toxin [Kiritimatiellia bacterium]|nr:type II toxin-antitoxin system VapC family toxin [Kiritimatiellia bacterium]